MSSRLYNVPNISCGHCVATIEREVKEVAGVESVSADLETKQVTVDYEDEAVPARVEGLLKEIGYPALE
jgi:copper chaperone